jgi:hypothetical protein
LLKKTDLIYASWKIDNALWKKRIETAEDDQGKEHLFLDIFSVEDDKQEQLDRIPVHGIENTWHIFVKDNYYGKRIVLDLTYRDRKGKFTDILNSPEINIPLSEDAMRNSQLDEDKILFELSEINLSAAVTSQNTSR